MGFFKKKIVMKTYDKENKKPVIKASICNGEQVAGFKDIHTGKIEEVMLIKNQADLDAFKKMYGIYGEIEKLAMDNGIRSIAFPSISTGVYSFPVELAAKIAVHTVNRFLQDNPDCFDLVEWVLFDTHTESVYEDEVDKIY